MYLKLSKAGLVFIYALIIWVAVGFDTRALGQSGEYSFASRLENRLKRQYQLSSGDLKLLRPLIEKGNESVAREYEHCSVRFGENFLSLWNAIRSNRMEFEGGFPTSLTSKQKQALKAARTEVETRVLILWLDDYLDTLAAILSLDRLQMAAIQSFLQAETDKRLRLIVKETEKNTIDSEWEKLTDEREAYLKEVLDPDQFRSYLSLGLPSSVLVG